MTIIIFYGRDCSSFSWELLFLCLLLVMCFPVQTSVKGLTSRLVGSDSSSDTQMQRQTCSVLQMIEMILSLTAILQSPNSSSKGPFKVYREENIIVWGHTVEKASPKKMVQPRRASPTILEEKTENYQKFINP